MKKEKKIKKRLNLRKLGIFVVTFFALPPSEHIWSCSQCSILLSQKPFFP